MATSGFLHSSLSSTPVLESSTCLSRRVVSSQLHVHNGGNSLTVNFMSNSSSSFSPCGTKIRFSFVSSWTIFSRYRELPTGKACRSRFEPRFSVNSSSSKVGGGAKNDGARDPRATDLPDKSSEFSRLTSLSSKLESDPKSAGFREPGVTDSSDESSAIPDLSSPNSMVNSTDDQARGILDTVVLVSPFFLWGTAMVAMKGLLPRAGPMFVASLRLIPAGFLLIGYGALSGKRQPAGLLAWSSIALFGFVDATCFQGFLVEGLKRTTAGLGSVIIDSQPLTVAILAALLFGESLGLISYLGIALGIAGLVLLEVPVEGLQSLVSGGGGVDTTWFSQLVAWEGGEWRMLLAAQSMAIGTVMVRWVCKYSDPFMATGWHMVLGGLPLLALSIYQQDPAVSGHIQELSVLDWSALAYTSVGGSAISYGLFFYNATKGSLTKLSALTFLTPMFAALFGFLFLSETLTPLQCVGGAITLAGVLLVNYKPKAD